MAAIIIPSSTSFGGLTNRNITTLLALNTGLERLKDAIASASAGYEGTPGTQFEANNMMAPSGYVPNNFGIAPNPATPGQRGTDYAYAVDVLTQAWATFWTAAEPSISQLDNGMTL